MLVAYNPMPLQPVGRCHGAESATQHTAKTGPGCPLKVLAGATVSLIHPSPFQSLSPGHRFGIIPAPGSFGASAFPVPPEPPGRSQNAVPRLGSSIHSAIGDPVATGGKGDNLMHLNLVQLIGFVGKDPERRQRHNSQDCNPVAYLVFSVATQQSWKDAAGA